MSAEVSEAAQPSTVDSALLAKLQSYPLVTSAFDYYFSIKSSSSLATNTLEFCESVAKRGYDMSAPVIRRVDDYAHLDERSVALLDAIEAQAVRAKEGYQSVNEVARHPLDSLIDAIDAYGPSVPSPPSQRAADGKSDAEEESVESLAPAKDLAPVQKITAIGNHLQRASMTKLRELQLRGPAHVAIAQNMQDLLGYTAAVLHIEGMSDRAAASIAETQHTLFAKAATAATDLNEILLKSSTVQALESKLEPVIASTRNAVDASFVRTMATIHAVRAYTDHFFENRVANVQEIAQNAAESASATLRNLRDTYPVWDSRIQSVIESLQASFKKSLETYNAVLALPKERLHEIVRAIYSVFQQLQSSVAIFRSRLLETTKKDVMALEAPSAPKAVEDEKDSEISESGDSSSESASESVDAPVELSSNNNASSSNNNNQRNNKKRRGGKH